ncbi:cardiolipin synthase [Mannheimia granulomatis]|uniref:Cardiolipin synthase n=1 Tax=Mannheimia granulomatis TaxID=85402 RepID=A0A6G8JHB4_9PAST|nr:cardiolipin synthase [Mannheimia granulomatis]QIM66501.1 cardiolipin synthase [Mannheimia granulomatis]
MLFSITWHEVLLLINFLIVLACAVRVLYTQRNIGTVFAWLIILFAFPMVGIITYLLIGEARVGKKRLARTADMKQFYDEFAEKYMSDEQLNATKNIPSTFQGIERMAQQTTSFGANVHNDMQLLTTTDDIIYSMIDDIQQAKSSCLLAFYIIDPQGKINELLHAVKDAAERGVHCVILADDLGSSRFFRSEWKTKLEQAGVFIQNSLPVGLFQTFYSRNDLRNHRKILIVDYHIGYTGSFNLVDPILFKQDAGIGEWVDVMMRCIGPVVLEMTAVLYADIAVESEDNLQRVKTYLKQKYEKNQQLITKSEGNITVQVIPSAPEQEDSIIYETILCAIHLATKRIVITTPYFVPNEPLLTALTTAARRGVDVTLILPEKNDSNMVRYASQAYFRMLLKHNVKIAQFKGGLLHAKTLVIDDNFSLFGTVNMDMRSFFLNLEISLAIYNQEMTQKIAALQQQYLQQSEYIDETRWLYRSKWWGLVENTIRLMSPLL